MDYPSTRKEAQRLALPHYFTGLPCLRGHTALRKTKGSCVECLKVDRVRDGQKRKLKPKSEAAKAAGRRYYERNVELTKARSLNQPLQDRREYRKKWRSHNRELSQAFANAWKRRAKNATPKWLTKDHRDQIREVYLSARTATNQTGIKHVVDHIVPLCSRVVCGLHVPWNLQVLTHIENSVKSNRL